MSFSNRIAGIIGNLLEHYDSALYALLAPFIAPLFFGGTDPVTALILTYGILPLGLLTRPLGSLCFGWIGDRFGRESALFYSLFGTALVTVGIGSLPIYQDVGVWAPVFLAIAKMLQSFFVAGESSGGAIFVLEHTDRSKRGFVSGLYDASSVGGVLIASFLVAMMSDQPGIEHNWRILFWAGGSTAFLGMFLRRRLKFVPSQKTQVNWFHIIKEHRVAFLCIILASGFSYAIYSLAFTLMNGYIPLITTLSRAEVIKVNTVLLVIDMLLLPLFGYIANKVGKERLMLLGAVCSIVSAIPLFALLNGATLGTVIAVRLTIIVFGTAFAAPYYAWAIELVPSQHRYLILSLGGALGSQLIGAPTASVSLWLYQTIGEAGAPGLYLMVGGIGAVLAVYYSILNKSRLAQVPLDRGDR